MIATEDHWKNASPLRALLNSTDDARFEQGADFTQRLFARCTAIRIRSKRKGLIPTAFNAVASHAATDIGLTQHLRRQRATVTRVERHTVAAADANQAQRKLHRLRVERVRMLKRNLCVHGKLPD